MGSGAGFYVHGDLDRTKRRRNKRKAFDKNLHYYKDDGIKNEFSKPSEARLEAIRKEIKQQQRSDRLKSIFAFFLGILVCVSSLLSVTYLLTT